jgi:hypothetical protein
VKLTSKTLKNVDGLNAWAYSENWVVRSNEGVGESVSLYFQIADLDRDGIRYVPTNAAVIQVTFPHLDDTQEFTVTGSFAFADDRSIIKVDLSADQVPASGAVRFTMTDGSLIRSWVVFAAVSVEKTNSECC